MKNYDDLQRFKEKTQTNHIQFKDMSDQLQKRGRSADWAIIRQLTQSAEGGVLDNAASAFRSVPQAVDPQAFAHHGTATPPARTDSPSVPAGATQPLPATTSSAVRSGGLLNALAAMATADAPARQAPLSPVTAPPVASADPAPFSAEARATIRPGGNDLPGALSAMPTAGVAVSSLGAAAPPSAASADPAPFSAEGRATIRPGGNDLLGALSAMPAAGVAVSSPGAAAPSSAPPVSSPTVTMQPLRQPAPASAADSGSPRGERGVFDALASAAGQRPPGAAAFSGASPSAPSLRPAGAFRQLFSAQPDAASDSKDLLLQPLLEKIASCR
nr:cellulose biosynthesis protein BcsO [Izhakiella australiensis]